MEKAAAAELFVKLAQENGINLNQMTDADISSLWQETFGEKTAEAAVEPTVDPTIEAAEQEHAEKQASLAKFAEAEELGRHMARSYVDELQKIGSAAKTAGDDKEEKKDDKDADDKDADDKGGFPFKKASAIDQLSAYKAVEKAASIGYSSEEAADRISAVLTLGLANNDGVKVASAPNVETATEIRSLELLEAAGYPVTWN
jgi:hypothetical protein